MLIKHFHDNSTHSGYYRVQVSLFIFIHIHYIKSSRNALVKILKVSYGSGNKTMQVMTRVLNWTWLITARVSKIKQIK